MIIHVDMLSPKRFRRQRRASHCTEGLQLYAAETDQERRALYRGTEVRGVSLVRLGGDALIVV